MKICQNINLGGLSEFWGNVAAREMQWDNEPRTHPTRTEWGGGARHVFSISSIEIYGPEKEAVRV